MNCCDRCQDTGYLPVRTCDHSGNCPCGADQVPCDCVQDAITHLDAAPTAEEMEAMERDWYGTLDPDPPAGT